MGFVGCGCRGSDGNNTTTHKPATHLVYTPQEHHNSQARIRPIPPTRQTHTTGRRDARGREEADTRARRHQQPSSLGQERPGTKRATSEPACVPLSLPFQQQQQQHRAQQQQQSVVIMSALVSAFGQAARAAAKALENAGRMLEAAPYVEHRK